MIKLVNYLILSSINKWQRLIYSRYFLSIRIIDDEVKSLLLYEATKGNWLRLRQYSSGYITAVQYTWG